MAFQIKFQLNYSESEFFVYYFSNAYYHHKISILNLQSLHDLLQKSDLQADEEIICYSAVCLSKIGCKGNLRRLVKFTLTNILQVKKI